MTGTLVTLPLILPVAGALLCLFLPVRMRAGAGLVVSAAITLAVLALARTIVETGELTHALGGWEAPLGIGLRVDGLTCVFLLLNAFVGLPVGVYAAKYFALPSKNKGESSLFWPLWLFLWASMNGIYLSVDLFNLYVVIEVLGISAVALAILSGRPAALIGGLRYLLAALVGSMAYLLGVALVYGSFGTLDLTLLSALVDTGFTTRLALGLILTGLFVKTALFPLHFWLPSAHASADPPVSAILSALVVKASFYLILRLWVDVFDVSLSYAAGQAAGALGAVAVVWGSYQALRQRSLKLMVAHSTVGQVGYLFLLFPLITVAYEGLGDSPWLVHAWTGGIYQALAHGFAKSAMFLAVGIFVLATGTDNRESIVNMVSRLPMTTFAFALAGVSLIGLPPSGGFVAKWMLLKAAFDSGQWWWAPMVLWGSFLTAGYVFMILRVAFAPARGKRDKPLRRVPRVLEVAALILGIGAIAIGFRAEEILTLIDIESPFADVIDPEEGGVSP
ncbi:MAG: hypothetical protein JJU00_09400 [Opitutales bacterium]|nr:hypothetical protein [Opitutales bacterium]